MTATLLIVTSIHPSDDPRIRYKYVTTLEDDFDIVYATRSPGPVDQVGFEWIGLKGGRMARWFRSFMLMMTARPDVIAIHDPELIPAALVARAFGRRSIVADIHEDVPAQIVDKTAIPRLLRRPVAALARSVLRLAERFLEVTLAEKGYQHLFRTVRPVFRNYPIATVLPAISGRPRSGVVYVGDVTRQRGAVDLVEAAALSGVGPVTYVGRCAPALSAELTSRALELGVDIDIRGWQPYDAAMDIAASALIGVSPLHDTDNYRNSLPTKTLEYLALGVPVVASDLPGTSAVIRDLPGVVLFPPGNLEALATALGSIDESTVAAAESGASAIRSEFKWPADDVREFYGSLLAP